MRTNTLPPEQTMADAFFSRDSTFTGIFFTGVRTTGIFCNPTCSAKKPLRVNIEFFGTVADALAAGYRPCKVCRPLEPLGTPPDWFSDLLQAVETDPAHSWSDGDLRRRGLSPSRVRRWFQRNYDMTFQAYCRARRIGLALRQIKQGGAITHAAYNHGYESLSGFNEAFKQYLGMSPTQARTAQVVNIVRLTTPLGLMLAGATDQGVCLLEFADRRMLETQLRRLSGHLKALFVPGPNTILEQLTEELASYFDGRLSHFSMPLITPGTEFQQTVWEALRQIPHGKTSTYKAIAESIGNPKAVRAVARANGDNRIAIIIPCHRVIGSDGQLTGYGGGLWRKQQLLDLEMVH